jgi:hypothetical protein
MNMGEKLNNFQVIQHNFEVKTAFLRYLANRYKWIFKIRIKLIKLILSLKLLTESRDQWERKIEGVKKEISGIHNLICYL